MFARGSYCTATEEEAALQWVQVVELKGSLMRDILARIDADESDTGRRIAARVPEKTRAVISALNSASWCESVYMMDLDQALIDELGEEAFVDYWTEFSTRATDVPVLRPILTAAMRMLVSPSLVAKALPRVYRAMVRGTGEMKLQKVGDGEAYFTMYGCDGFRRPKLFGLANLGGIRGGFALAKADAKVQLEMLTPGSPEAEAEQLDALALRYKMRW